MRKPNFFKSLLDTTKTVLTVWYYGLVSLLFWWFLIPYYTVKDYKKSVRKYKRELDSIKEAQRA